MTSITFKIIFVVFATLTQSYQAQQQSPSVYGLDEVKSAGFYTIKNNEKSTKLLSVDVINQLFDVLEILTAKRNFHLQSEAIDYSTLINGAIVKAKTACDYTFNSVSAIVGGYCAAAETFRTSAHRDLDNAFTQYRNAIGFADSGNITNFGVQFEPFATAAKTSLETFVGRIYDAIRTCTNTNNADALAETEVHQIEATKRIVHASFAYFDALKVFAGGIFTSESTSYNTGPSILQEISYYRREAVHMIEDNVRHNFSPVKGFYLSTQLNKQEAAANLTSDQYVEDVADSNYDAAAEIIFNMIKDFLTKLKLGLSDGCNGDESAIDAAQTKAVEHYKTGLFSLARSIPNDNPTVTQTIIQPAMEYFDSYCESGGGGYFVSMRYIVGQEKLTYSELMRRIQAKEDELQAGFPIMFRHMFNIVQLGRGNVPGVTSFKDNANQAGYNYGHNVYEGIRILARACYGLKPVTQEDFDALENAKNGIATAVKSMNSNVSSGRVSLLKILDLGVNLNVQLLGLNVGVGLGLNLG